MRKGIQWIVISMLAIALLVSGLTQGSIEAQAVKYDMKAYKEWDIRTATKTTGKEIDAYVKKKKGTSNPLYGYGNVIVESATKNGITPEILFGMIVNETSWGESYKFQKLHNSGGIKCMSSLGFQCENGFTKFQSGTEGIRAHAELLDRVYVKYKKYTAEEMLLKYAPTFENNLYGAGGYLAVLTQMLVDFGNTMADNKKEFGQKKEGDKYEEVYKGDKVNGNNVGGKGTNNGAGTGGSSGTKTGGDRVGDFGYVALFFEPKKGKMVETIDSGKENVGSDIGYGFVVFSDKVTKVSIYFVILFTLLGAVYLSIITCLYVVLLRGYSYNDQWYTKLTNAKHGAWTKEGKKELLYKYLWYIGLLAFLYSEMYVRVMYMVYKGLQYLYELW